ncbi:pectate lyase [Rhizobacter sp. Root1221]|nr:pectate lyase [Rhizobacter sp. Root1221]
MLSQTGNPVYKELNGYTEWLSGASDDAAKLAADKVRADKMITWQMPHGGFYKNAVKVYDTAWDGKAERSGWKGASGVELGTIDNDATVTELLFLSDVYRRSGVAAYRDAARKALDFLLTMQYSSGGWPQVYPARTGTIYSNYVTFNDNAMIRVMTLLDHAAQRKAPFEGDVFTAAQRDKLTVAIDKGVDFILKAQIVQAGVKTVWCAQHDPVTYAPRGARSFELPSKSGQESVLVVAFLMTRPQTPAIKSAVKSAIAWYKNPAVKVEDTAYVSRPSGSTDDKFNQIVSKAGSTMWYRFYDLDTDVGFFSGRLPTDNPPGAGKRYNLMDIEPERRYGYQWGGSYGDRLFAYTDKVGY